MSTPDAESTKATLAKSAASWLLGQPFNNVLTVAVLATLIGAAYLVRNDVPKHIDAIKAGYREVTEEQSRQIQYITETHERQHDRDGEVIRDLLKAHGIQVGDEMLKRPHPTFRGPVAAHGGH